MGIFSEIDLEQEYQEDILTETPETPQSPAVEPQPPAVEIVPKVEQPETQASTDSQNKTEAAADEDAKRKEHDPLFSVYQPKSVGVRPGRVESQWYPARHWRAGLQL